MKLSQLGAGLLEFVVPGQGVEDQQEVTLVDHRSLFADVVAEAVAERGGNRPACRQQGWRRHGFLPVTLALGDVGSW